MTVEGIQCNGAAFLASFQEGPYQRLFFQGFFSKSASKMASCIIVDMLILAIFCNLFFFFYFLSLKYGVRT